MAEPKEIGTRLLRKLIGYGELTTDAGGEPDGHRGSDWVPVTDGTVTWFLWRGYFDLSGMTVEQQTLFMLGVVFQESDTFILTNAQAAGSLRVYDIVSKRFIDDDSFNVAHMGGPFGNTWFAPGMEGSAYDLEEICYGRYRQFAPDTAIPGGLIQVQDASWGTGTATAGSRLYITRAIFVTGMTTSGLITSPPTAVVIPGTIALEEDLQFMERLRRSYVIPEDA